MIRIDNEAAELRQWFSSPRFKNTRRLYPAREVAEQRGTIHIDYTVAREAAEAFYTRLRELFAQKKCITTFGPYSPGQAVAMKRTGIEGIYVGGWATSAKGSVDEDPGPDLAAYPLSRVPDEAAPIVRALLVADKNQWHARARMSEQQRKSTPIIDFRPFIIADADTGHGGDAHVRNLIRRFVEAGVPGFHIEDQKPGVKKCGHQGGKVLVSQDEQLKRLSAARFQLDVMRVPGILVARTDAEAATLLDGRGDERDQPFILGATNLDLPAFKAASLAILRQLHELGIEEMSGGQLYATSKEELDEAADWLKRNGLWSLIGDVAGAHRQGTLPSVDAALDKVLGRFVEVWYEEAGVKTYAEAVADELEFRAHEGVELGVTRRAWLERAGQASHWVARRKAARLGLSVVWDCEHAKTPDGYYQVRGGIDYAIAKSLAAAPFADLLWMETKTPNLDDAKKFAEAIHAQYPEHMLAYNLSPSFNWDTAGMTEDEMRRFPDELGRLGYVFNFITYGGHQIDGRAAEKFSMALRQDGMLALARLQRELRLLDSPYRTPQTLVGGARLDAGLMAISGRSATTKAMGKGSTQFQHLVQTEVPTKLLEEWLDLWRQRHDYSRKLVVSLKPCTIGSDLLDLRVRSAVGAEILNVVFEPIRDRRGRSILLVRDENTIDVALRRQRLMTLAQLFLIHRYQVDSVHFLTPTEDNRIQVEKMKSHDIYSAVNTEIGMIIVADVNKARIKELVAPDRAALSALVTPDRASAGLDHNVEG